MTRIVAPSRLHFGLFNLPSTDHERWPGIDGLPGLPIRQFGGIGLMIDRPGLTVRVEPSDNWHAQGPHAERALEFAKHFMQDDPRRWAIVVEDAPPEHVGLGVGTQLGLSVAKALAVETGHEDRPAAELARRVGRGERSAIGIHGFDRGGLIVEGGKTTGEAISPLIGRFDFPKDWAIVLASPEPGSGWHGIREREALASIEPAPTETAILCRLVLMNLLPALVAKDVDAFGDALYEFNARVGDVFAEVQGGRYSSPAVAACIDNFRELGVKGTGQSSWGPTAFAIVKHEEVAGILAKTKASAIEARASEGAATDSIAPHTSKR